MNATKFALAIGREDDEHQVLESANADWNFADVTETLDRSVMAKLAEVIRTSTDALESYEHSKALEAIETFFWEFCDDYIELAKNRAYGTAESTGRVPSESAIKSARTTLGLALDALARLFAPYLPYATEEVWSWMHDSEGSVHRASWPCADAYEKAANGVSADTLAYAGEALAALRKIKSEAKVSMKTPILRVTLNVAENAYKAVEDTLDDVAEAGRVTGEVKLDAVKAAVAADTESAENSAESDASNVNVSVAQSELGEPPAKKK